MTTLELKWCMCIFELLTFFAATSIIIPLYNGEKYLEECLASVYAQDVGVDVTVELSLYNDASTDSSMEIFEKWREKLESRSISVIVATNETGTPKGVGFAKNAAIQQSCGKYLCFLDADDIMDFRRIRLQYNAALSADNHTLFGSKFRRVPENSTERFTRWANEISADLLDVQIYTSHGPTVIMPTWFCSRETYNKVEGGFDQSGKGTPEDLIFFYAHLDAGGCVKRIDEELLVYRYHPEATTFSIHEDTIWRIRMDRLERRVLSSWSSFTIWNAGKQGRRFYRSLSDANRRKVVAFCDVDDKKIAKKFYIYEESKEVPRPRVPVIHFRDAKPPLVVCMKIDLTGGGFEENLKSMNLTEGKEYVHFA